MLNDIGKFIMGRRFLTTEAMWLCHLKRIIVLEQLVWVNTALVELVGSKKIIQLLLDLR